MLINFLNKIRIEAAVVFLVIILLSALLMLRPITGVADNGDFARIMNSTGLSYLSDVRDDRYFGYVNRLYGIVGFIPFGGAYLSTQIPLVLLAVYLCKAVSNVTLFDIRFLGMIYVVLLAAAAFLAANSVRRKAGLVSLFTMIFFIIVFCDIGYTAYFNSLYGEPVTFVFLLLMAGAALMLSSQEKPSILVLILFCTAAFFFAGAKVQNSPAGLLAAILCFRLAWLRRDKAWRRIAIFSAVSVAVVSLACFASVSREIKVCNKYQSVFYGVLKNSPNPAGDLKELGLAPSLAVLAGTNYFMEEYPINIRTPEFKNMLFENIGYTKVAGFYLRHPERLLQKLVVAAGNGFQLKQGFGNYEKIPGIRYKQTSAVPSIWSDFKMNVLPHTLPFICSFFVFVFLVLIYEYRRAEAPVTRFMIEFFGFIGLIGIMQFILPVLADGEADLSKHLFLFNLCFDILFSAGMTYLVLKGLAVVRHFRE